MPRQFISRGFKGKARETDQAIKARIPPGQRNERVSRTVRRPDSAYAA